MDTYSGDGEHSIYSNDKSTSNYKKVSDKKNYNEFVSSLAWALTTKEGFNANKDKYLGDKSIVIPATKLVFLVEQSDSGQGITATGVNSIIELVNKNGSGFKGFVLGGLDMKQMRIDDSDTFNKDLNKNISLINAIYNAKISSSSSLEMPLYKPTMKKEKTRYVSISNENFVDYPDLIGSYIYGMQVEYKDNQYECIANDGTLCNNPSYLPGTAIGSHVWTKLDIVTAEPADENGDEDSFITYPNGIGSYKDGTIVFVDEKTFVCIDGQSSLCNDKKYSPIGDNAFKAWEDVTLSDNESGVVYSKVKNDDSVYEYPLHIASISNRSATDLI